MSHFKKVKQFLQNFAVLIISILFFIFIAEISLKVLSEKLHIMGIGNNHNILFCEYDPLLGWRKISNGGGIYITQDYTIHEKFNSKGIRGQEYSYNKLNNEKRILIIGDSFAEGASVEFSNLFSEVLKEKLFNKRGIYYEVINAGTCGYSTDQELLFFESEGKKYKPDITIVMFYENDVWYNNQPRYWRGNKPVFKLENETLILTNVPVPKSDKNLDQSFDKEPLFEKVKKWLSRKSYLYRFIRDKIKTSIFLYKIAGKLGLANKYEAIPDEFRVWERKYSGEISKAWNITKALLIRLKLQAESIGSKLLIFYVPNSASIYNEEWQDAKLRYNLSDNDWNIDQAGIELKSFCATNKIDFINPTEPFKTRAEEIKRQGRALYFVKDGHWTIEGNKLAAEILYNYIKCHYLKNR
jgi:hypothetical protein